MLRFLRVVAILFAISLTLAFETASSQELPSIETTTEGLNRTDGFIPFYWDEAKGKVWLEIDRWDEDFLYAVSQPAGLGSNDIGLDRGQLGSQQIVRFERVGPKVFLVEKNLRYRANSDNPSEIRAMRDSFAESVLWGFPVAAQTGSRVLVDATTFVVRDAHGVVESLKRSGQGTFRFEDSRSAPYPPMLKAFPRNTELEARVTFTSDSPGRYVMETAANASSFTVRVRHSLVELPDDEYEPRMFHPGSGYFGGSYLDYAVPIGTDRTQRFITRHRLEKTDPNARESTVKEPIVYYLDPGTPEPVRSALLDGARWWADAFRAAGFIDAFRVEMLPPDADPMDVRYNLIQWVHRSTRGWSYGSSITDPRTGEIIKGHVSLGSLRVRQDYLIAEGLLAPYTGGDAEGMEPEKDPMLAMALARLRQLSAHEVGHTLGLSHNFAASVNNRASVMDYPAPLAKVRGSGIDLRDAYDTGIGEWDIVTIRYGYSQFRSRDNEKVELDKILEDAERDGLRYITDQDARATGGAHPEAHLWDNGTNAVNALQEEMRVRDIALRQFDETVVKVGAPLATIEEALVPLYLRHRYQVEATSKLIAGVAYSYALREKGGTERTLPVANVLQREAIAELTKTLSPKVLRLPASLAGLIPPRPPGYDSHRELFDRHSGLVFDSFTPAETAAAMVFDQLLHPQRAARLIYQASMDRDLPHLFDLLNTVNEAVFSPQVGDPVEAEIARIVQATWVDALLELASSRDATTSVRSVVTDHLKRLRPQLSSGRRNDRADDALLGYLSDEIGRFLNREYDVTPGRSELTAPPGAPIGQSSGNSWEFRQKNRRSLIQSLDETWLLCGNE